MKAPFEARNHQLDGLRGYAALAVVFFHSVFFDPTMAGRVLGRDFSELKDWYDLLAKLLLIIFNGQAAVVIFFILSGAVLFESLQREKGSISSVVGKFLIRRFFRIYPALVVCLLTCWVAFYFLTTPRSVEQLLQNIFLFDFPVNGPTWTLNVEALGALFLIAAFVAFQAFGEVGVIVVGCVFGALYLQPFNGHLTMFKMFIYCFTLGALITTRLGKWVIDVIPTRSWPIILIGMLFARGSIQETIAALLVGLLYYRKAGSLGDFLSRPISVFLGSVSYSVYLFNVLFYEIIVYRAREIPVLHSYPIEFGAIMGVIIVVLTLPIAYLSLRFVEKPFIRMSRYLTSTRDKEASASLIAADGKALDGSVF